jgi:hypothetical protein
MKTDKKNKYHCENNERRLNVCMCSCMYDVYLCVRGKGFEWECNLDVQAVYAVYSDVTHGKRRITMQLWRNRLKYFEAL